MRTFEIVSCLNRLFSEFDRLADDVGVEMLSEPFRNGMFIGQHGSWNRSEYSGYKVIFVPFKDGRPDGMPVDVLTGFLKDDGSGVRATGRRHGRQGRSAARC
jgi:glucose/arabinose dehydrogenase